MLNRQGSRLVSACSRSQVLTSSPVRRRSASLRAMAAPRFSIVSDLDHTMVDHQDDRFESLLAFNRLWSSKFRHDSYLVFSTGRSHVKYEQLREEAPLLTPDLLICSVGTEIYLRTPEGLRVDDEWNAELDKGWNRDLIVDTVKQSFAKLSPQGDTEQRPHKVSYSLDGEGIDKEQYVQQLREQLAQAGLKVKVVYSGGSDVDVLPECASKGLALQFLQRRWEKEGKLPTDGIQVNGDSGNDAELFEVPNVYGCIVRNAMDELVKWAEAHPDDKVYRAKERCAAGIVETMQYFGKVPGDDTLPPFAKACQALVNLYACRMDWLNGDASGDDTLQSQIGARLAGSFAKEGSSRGTVDRGALLKRTADDHAKHSSAPVLLWLDCLRCESASDAEVTVTYSICHKPVGGKRKPEKGYRATLVQQEGCPEGMALAKLVSGVEAPH